MICKYCGEEVVPNTVKKSPAPFVYHPWKHAGTHFIGCYDQNCNPTGHKAEPKEEK